jgi:hypothetical protein
MARTLEEAVSVIQTSPFTAMIVNREGEIIDLVSRNDLPDETFMDQLHTRFRGAACRVFSQGTYQVDDIRNVIKGLLEAIDLLDAGRLKPGANYF